MVEKPLYPKPTNLSLRTGAQVPVVSVVQDVKSKEPKPVPSGSELKRPDPDLDSTEETTLDTAMLSEKK